MGKGSGDKLAGGAIKATFASSEPGISQEKFDLALGDFDPLSYLKRAEKAEEEARKRRVERLAEEEVEAAKLERAREQRNRNANLS